MTDGNQISPSFFGYGSLVNTATHGYLNPQPAKLRGWRRIWRHSNTRDVAFLSVHRVAGGVIDGLLATVPGGDWAALDKREHGYHRHALPLSDLALDGPAPHAPHIYEANPLMTQDASVGHPILLSYLDVVTQGFLQVFGHSGAEAFFASTDGWGPILDDRAAPVYPRAQVLDPAQTDFVDAQVARLSSVVTPL